MVEDNYIVKTMNDGKHGVYDKKRACFPVEGPELRARGIDRLEWIDLVAQEKINAMTPYATNPNLGRLPACGSPNCTLCRPDAACEGDQCRRLSDNLLASEKSEREKAEILWGIAQVLDIEPTGSMDNIRPEVSALSDRCSLAEAERDRFDKEADDLAAALERVTIERDYLLKMRDWCDLELLPAWEELEAK